MNTMPPEVLSPRPATPISVSFGDGKGPVVMEHILSLLQEAGARLFVNSIDVGENFYKREHYNGIPSSAWKTIQRHPIILMAPSRTPKGAEYRPLLHTLCRCLELHTVVTPMTPHNYRNVVIAKNETAFGSTLAYQTTPHIIEEKTLHTSANTQQLVQHGLSTAHIMGIDTIDFLGTSATSLSDMMLKKAHTALSSSTNYTSGFHISSLAEWLDTSKESLMITQESGIAKTLPLMAHAKELGAAYLGGHYILFTSRSHDVTLSAMLQAAILMLAYIDQGDVASTLEHAWRAIEDSKKLSDDELVSALLAQLKKQEDVEPLFHSPSLAPALPIKEFSPATQQLIGVEIFFDHHAASATAAELAEQFQQLTANTTLKLQMLGSRGFTIWPEGTHTIEKTDVLHARFFPATLPKKAEQHTIAELITTLTDKGVTINSVQPLYVYDEEIGFSAL